MTLTIKILNLKNKMNKETTLGISKFCVRLIIGLVFIVAAIFKLLSIDYFEIYIYSFNLFGYGLATVLSRLLICAELLLGLGMILKIRYKEVWWLSMLMMIGFTLFLIYVIVFRNDDNCHCFGELLKLDPKESIFKNIISGVLLLFVHKEEDYNFKPRLRKWLIGISIAIAVILPFVVFPMDTVYKMIVSKSNDINTVEFENSLNDKYSVFRLNRIEDKVNDTVYMERDTLTPFNIYDGKYFINYVSSGCNFCKMGTKKLMMILNHNNIDKKNIKFLIWGYEADIIKFMDETNSADCEYWFISPITSLEITYGKFPSYIWTDNGKLIDSGDLRDLNENKIVEFFK